MFIATNEETCNQIKTVLEAQSDKPQNLRVFIAGMACSGPSFGLGLDNVNETDLTEEHFGVKFVMEKSIYDQIGEIKVEFIGNGYAVQPINPPVSACGSCSSCG